MGTDWHVRVGHDGDVDFRVSVLERDGLQVPPFDRYSDGDGSPRALGFDGASWRAWFERVVKAMADLDDVIGRRSPDLERFWSLRLERLWGGEPPVGERLAALAAEYKTVANARRFSEPWRRSDRRRFSVPRRVFNAGSCSMRLRPQGVAGARRLWSALVPYQDLMPPLRVVDVTYPEPVRTVVPLAAVVLGRSGRHVDDDRVLAEVLTSAKTLATMTPPSTNVAS